MSCSGLSWPGRAGRVLDGDVGTRTRQPIDFVDAMNAIDRGEPPGGGGGGGGGGDRAQQDGDAEGGHPQPVGAENRVTASDQRIQAGSPTLEALSARAA